MKRTFIILTVFVFVFSLFSVSGLTAKETTDWESFSKNLVKALKSSNEGLQVSAMQLVIKYGEKVDVDNAVLEIVKLYRNHKDVRVRQIALVTINAMENDWAIGIIKRDFAFENSQKIKRMMAAIIVAHQKKDTL